MISDSGLVFWATLYVNTKALQLMNQSASLLQSNDDENVDDAVQRTRTTHERNYLRTQ